MKKKALVAVGALALMLCSVSVFAAGTCQDWEGVWEFTYDNGTAKATFCFDNNSVIDNETIAACDNDSKDNCTCIDNISITDKQLCIDNVTFAQCDNNSIDNCTCVDNPLYKKLTVPKGKYEVKLTDVQENFSMGPLKALCYATGKRGTQAITINQPDNASLAEYAQYYPNAKKGMYFVQEGAGQDLSKIALFPQARILKENFLGDNFTTETNWNITGLVSGTFVRELTCEEKGLDNCDNATCDLTIVPKKISKLLSFINPIVPFVISGGSDVEFARPIAIDWGTDAIKTLVKIKLGKRSIFGLIFKRPLKLESDNYTVTVTYGDNDTEQCGTIEVK
jgi:hypothetical protein